MEYLDSILAFTAPRSSSPKNSLFLVETELFSGDSSLLASSLGDSQGLQEER